MEEGGWQSRFLGELDADAIASIRGYANVKDVVVNRKQDGEGQTVTELYFYQYQSVFSDTIQIAELVGVPLERVDYHYGLLAMYLVRSEKDPSPRMLFPLFLIDYGAGLLFADFYYTPCVCCIDACEGAPVWHFSKRWSDAEINLRMSFARSSGALCDSGTGRKSAWHCREHGTDTAVELCTWKRDSGTASLSLVCAFMAFTIMQCFFVTSQISTRETYFERYQDAWDLMVTVQNAAVDTFDKTKAVQDLDGVKSAVAYQKVMAKSILTEKALSAEMKSFGGFSHASGDVVSKVESGWRVNAPLVILDDHSFMEYCEQIGITPRLDGAVILNRIRDVTNPDFRHPVFMPYLKGNEMEERAVSVLSPAAGEDRTVELAVLSYTREVPVLREEYAKLDYYELVHFLPASLWKEIKEQMGADQSDLFLRVLGRENSEREELSAIQSQIGQLLSGYHIIEIENRIQEYETNRKQIQGMRMIFGGFCVLLAIIGIGDVFSNTLGFVRQRKREFARYLSVGMTPKEIRKMFCIEALVLAGRPILITLPLAALAVGSMLKISYLKAGEFLAEAPFVPIGIFMLAVSGSVAFAYMLAWRNMRKICLAQALKDDTMM